MKLSKVIQENEDSDLNYTHIDKMNSIDTLLISATCFKKKRKKSLKLNVKVQDI